jgi:hypothetical protein
MTQLATKIKLYAKANGVTSINFLKDVRLQDDMIDGVSSQYIKEWNLDITKPTDEQLATYEDEANAEEALNTILSNRRSEYPNHNDCIHALLDGGDTLTDLQAKRQEVKSKYPKP